MPVNNKTRWALGCVGALAIICLGLAIVVPLVVKQQASKWVAGHTSRSLRIESVRFNPLGLWVSIRGVSLSEPGEPTHEFVGFERLDTALSLRSVLDGAVILRKLRLEGPRVRLVRTAANSYNFADLQNLGKSQPQPAVEPPGEPLHFSVNNINIVAGRIDFFDRALATEQHHVVSNLDLDIPFIGNVPYLTDLYVTPRLQARVNSAPLVFEGKLKPFRDGAETIVDLSLDELKLADYTSYLPTTLPLQIQDGRFDCRLTVTYRVSKNRKPEIELAGKLHLAEFRTQDRQGQPLFAMRDLDIELAPSRPLQNDLHIATLNLRGPQLEVLRTRDGSWNLPGLERPPAPPTLEKSAPAESTVPPLRLRLDRLTLRDGELHFNDQLPTGGFRTYLQQLTVDVNSFDSRSAEPARLAFGFTTARHETLTIAGNVATAPLATELSVKLQNLSLADYYPYLQAQLTAPIAGRLALQGQVRYSAAGGLGLQAGQVQLTELQVPFRPGESFTLDRLTASGLQGEVAGNAWQLEELNLDGGRFVVTRQADGRWSPQALLRQNSAPAATVATSTPHTTPAPPRLLLEKLRLNNWQGRFHDETVQASMALSQINFALDHLVYPQLTVARSALDLRLAQGRLQLEAAGRLTPTDVNGRLRLQRLPLSEFWPYVPAQVRVLLVNGELNADLRYRLARPQQQLRGYCRGALGLGNLYLVNADTADDLLRWENLSLQGIDANLEQNRLQIDKIALSGPVSKLTINPDGRLNLGTLIRRDEGASALPAEGTAVQSPVTAPPAPPRDWFVTIAQVTLQDGRCDFTDRHMTPPFHANMVELGGRISGLSSSPEMLAEVDLRGSLENRAPLQISGVMNPLSKTPRIALKVAFSDIELSPVTPYSSRYLGYTVDKGKLFLDLDYRIDNKELAASNRIFFDQFTFGEAVASDEAVKLPVKLAVALLKDSKGEIHLDVPVSGRTDDPQFSVWRIVLQVLKNLLVKAATSPLSLLTALGGGEDFTAVQFAPGSAQLRTEERQNLARLATALADRPALKLQLTGHAEAGVDAEAWRHEELERRLQRAKYLELTRTRAISAEPGDAIVVTPEERSRYLLEVYRKADFPKPRNAIGLLKNLPDAEMEKLLLTHTAVGTEELTALAWARSNTVMRELVEQHGLAAARIFQNNVVVSRPADQSDDWHGNRVEFGVATD